jgi:outer membrane protein OmpA-like peptidoglycan-associated protein
MVSSVVDIRGELDANAGELIARSARRRRKSPGGRIRNRAWLWISLGIAGAAGIGAFALQLPNPPASIRSYRLDHTTSLPASLYFDAEHMALDAEDRQSIVALAGLVKSNSTPVVVAAYADPSGNRDSNLRLAQKRAADVRDALVTAGVPTLRIVLVSPAFAATNAAWRVEISSVHGVRVFPPRRTMMDVRP